MESLETRLVNCLSNTPQKYSSLILRLPQAFNPVFDYKSGEAWERGYLKGAGGVLCEATPLGRFRLRVAETIHVQSQDNRLPGQSQTQKTLIMGNSSKTAKAKVPCRCYYTHTHGDTFTCYYVHACRICTEDIHSV